MTAEGNVMKPRQVVGGVRTGGGKKLFVCGISLLHRDGTRKISAPITIRSGWKKISTADPFAGETPDRHDVKCQAVNACMRWRDAYRDALRVVPGGAYFVTRRIHATVEADRARAGFDIPEIRLPFSKWRSAKADEDRAPFLDGFRVATRNASGLKDIAWTMRIPGWGSKTGRRPLSVSDCSGHIRNNAPWPISAAPRSGGHATLTAPTTEICIRPYPDSSWEFAIGTGSSDTERCRGTTGFWPCPQHRTFAELIGTFRRPNYGSDHISKHCCLLFCESAFFRKSDPFWRRCSYVVDIACVVFPVLYQVVVLMDLGVRDKPQADLRPQFEKY